MVMGRSETQAAGHVRLVASSCLQWLLAFGRRSEETDGVLLVQGSIRIPSRVVKSALVGG
jgi:hypothetical protein